jgi:glycosyltransferase involved in cell wall biosynthesis
VRILALDQFGELGGAQQCLLDLIPALHEREWEVHVAAPDGPLAARCREIGATFSPIRCGPYSRGKKPPRDILRFAFELPGLRGEIARLAERFRADLLYVNGPRLLPAAAWASRDPSMTHRAAQIPGLTAGAGCERRAGFEPASSPARKGGVELMDGLRASRSQVLKNPFPVLFHCHSFLGNRSGAWPAGISLWRSQARVIASCQFVAQPLARWCAHPPTIVYNGVPASRFTRSEFAPGGVWRIGIVGRIAPEKGQTDFLKVARLLAERDHDCRFVVCGAVISSDPASIAYGKEIRRLAQGLPVEFTGWRGPVDSIFSELDVLVAPSAPGEATTRVILEAYAAGVPVVAYASGGIPEVVTNGRTGLLVSPAVPQALSGRIRELISGPRERVWELSRQAHEEWRAKYTLEQYRRRIVEIICTTVSEARGPA